MLTPQLKQTLNEKWDNCWPVSNLRPVAILDLISYIFFIKKLDDLNRITKKIASIQDNQFIYTKEIESFNWRVFKDLNAQDVHELFTKEYGLLDLMKQYGQTDLLYSDFFKERLLITPTPKLLSNGIDIVNLIESSDSYTQAAIVEFLFKKAGNSQNQAQFIPEYISRLMVSIAEPHISDVILDPCAGNGSLLVNAAEYLENNNAAGFHPASKLKGFESNIIHLRMAAMRMILHGIQSPDLKISGDKTNSFTAGNTLILSSLLCIAVEGKITGEDLLPQPGHLQKEMQLLNDIIEQMQGGDRAVVLVPENFLKSTLSDIQAVRKELVESTNLEGVINLSSDSKSIFSSAGIFIFNKKSSATTSEVWFCKIEKPKKKRTINETVKNPEINDELLKEQLRDVKFLLDKWKNRSHEDYQSNSFTISVYDIKANNYNLNYNDYKLIRREQAHTTIEVNEPADELATVIPSKRENLHHFFEASPPLQEPKRKRKVVPAVLFILLLICCGCVYFFKYKGYKIPFIQTNGVKGSAAAISKIPVRNSSIQSDAPITKESTKEENDSQIQEKVIPVSPVKAVSITSTSDSTAQASNSTVPRADSSDKYTVIDKAWFHYEPDSGKRKSVFLQARKDLVLTPTAEENGFVYVVYINNKGQSTHGWLDKKDLEPVE